LHNVQVEPPCAHAGAGMTATALIHTMPASNTWFLGNLIGSLSQREV
jgi:hypothetical protein